MRGKRNIKGLITYHGKGVTPKYVTDSSIIVLNQKCIRNNRIDYSFSQFITDEKEYNQEKFLKKGDLLINSTGQGTAGRVAFVENVPNHKKVLTDSHILILRLDNFYEAKCLNYFLFSIQDMLQTFMDGSTGQGEFDKIRLFNLNVPFSENTFDQKQIVSFLSFLDSKIELNNRINAELEAMAKTIYDYWFVQFDFPDKNGKPHKTSGGKMVWNEELKREIPKGWGAQKMAEWINIDKSGDWGKEEAEGNFTKKVVCFRGADINGLNGLDVLKPPVRYILEKNSFKILQSHDLIIEISGGSPTQSTGRLAFITDATMKRFNHPLICSNFCRPVSMRNKKLLYNFVYYWNSLYNSGAFFGYEGKTSGIKNLLLDSFVNSYYTVVPDDKIVDKFYDLMESIQEKKQTALAENQQLSNLRDWLLPMLMNGQVSVGKAYERVEEVLNMAAEDSVTYTKTIQLPIPKNKTVFAKQVLAGKIVSLFKEDKNFTHIKFQKLQFLAEHIGEADLALNYYFQAAGPYDNRFMHTIFDSLRKSKWFDKQKYKFVELEKQNQIDGYYKGYFSTVENKLDKLFNLLSDITEATAEIIATVYAVWNNKIILKQGISEELIIQDFYNWSERKQRYNNPQVQDAIKWLKDNNFEPVGFGKEIKTAKKKST